jgi:hypothetical protein
MEYCPIKVLLPLSNTISLKGGNAAIIKVTDGTKTAYRTIFINDATSNNAIDTVPFILGDKLNITPSLSNDKKTLYLTANTTYNYQCNSDKMISFNKVIGNEYSVSYGGVIMSSTICPTKATANCINSFNNMVNGTFPFTINYENKTFTGTITVSNNTCDFNFTNNSLINFTTKHAE